MTDHDARLGWIGNRHLFHGVPLLAPDEERRGDRRCERAGDIGHWCAPLVMVSSNEAGKLLRLSPDRQLDLAIAAVL
jgi:hypothetical protein